MDKQLVLRPRLSEKAYDLSQKSGVYVFVVPTKSNKQSVARAVSAQFDVTVTDIRIAHLPAKAKRSIRKAGRYINKGTQSGVKKAYVTLKEGDSIPIFAQEDEEKARTEKLNQQLERSRKK